MCVCVCVCVCVFCFVLFFFGFFFVFCFNLLLLFLFCFVFHFFFFFFVCCFCFFSYFIDFLLDINNNLNCYTKHEYHMRFCDLRFCFFERFTPKPVEFLPFTCIYINVFSRLHKVYPIRGSPSGLGLTLIIKHGYEPL